MMTLSRGAGDVRPIILRGIDGEGSIALQMARGHRGSQPPCARNHLRCRIVDRREPILPYHINERLFVPAC